MTNKTSRRSPESLSTCKGSRLRVKTKVRAGGPFTNPGTLLVDPTPTGSTNNGSGGGDF